MAPRRVCHAGASIGAAAWHGCGIWNQNHDGFRVGAACACASGLSCGLRRMEGITSTRERFCEHLPRLMYYFLDGLIKCPSMVCHQHGTCGVAGHL